MVSLFAAGFINLRIFGDWKEIVLAWYGLRLVSISESDSINFCLAVVAGVARKVVADLYLASELNLKMVSELIVNL